jgi:hypothetical protein
MVFQPYSVSPPSPITRCGARPIAGALTALALVLAPALSAQTVVNSRVSDSVPAPISPVDSEFSHRDSAANWGFTPSVVTSTANAEHVAISRTCGEDAPPRRVTQALNEDQFESQPRFWWALGEVTLANAMDWLHHRILIQADWTKVSPSSWVHNVTNGLQWDYDPLEINNVTHPYSGGQYYNAARANGYGVWGSAAFAMGGSVMWEYLGETQSPSPNDLLNTLLGGTVYGEVAWRISVAMLDDQATGMNRFLREFGSLLINPGLGVHRIIHGDAWHTSPSLPTISHGPIRLDLALGTTKATPETPTLDQRLNSIQPALTFLVNYGDPFQSGSQRPLSVFSVRTEMTGPVLTRLAVVGQLARPSLSGTDEDRSSLGVDLESDYLVNPAYRFATANLTLRHTATRGSVRGWRLGSNVGLIGVVLGAASNGSTRPGWDYDYGPGIGVRLGGLLEYSGNQLLSVGYDGYWVHSLMGPTTNNWLQNVGAQIRTPRLAGLYAAADYQKYWRLSEYPSIPSERRQSQKLTLFLGLTGR